MLATLAEKEGDYERAEFWYTCILLAEPKYNNHMGVTVLYERLAENASKRSDSAAQQHWLFRALELWENRGNIGQAAFRCLEIGRFFAEEGNCVKATEWMIRAVTKYREIQYQKGIDFCNSFFDIVYAKASPSDQRAMLERWAREPKQTGQQ